MITKSENSFCDKFENSLLLFIDRDLSGEQLSEFSTHIHKCSRCSKLLADTVDILYSSKNEQVDISEDQFDVMISKSLKKRKNRFSLFGLSIDQKEKLVFYWKIAFATLLVFASITISLISNRINPVKQVSRELLDWEGTKVQADINSLGQSIDAMNRGDWNNKINQIDNKLEQLEKESDKYSFN